MYPGSLSNLELQALRSDQNREIGNGTQCIFYRYPTQGNTYGTQVDASGNVTTATPTTIYAGPCYFTTVEARRDRYETRLGEHVYLKQYRVNIPATSDKPQENDRFRVTASHADAELIGRVMIVKDVHHDSELSIRRITLIDSEE